MRMRGIAVDYDSLVTPRPSLLYDEVVEHVRNELPALWQKAYRKMAQSPTSIHHFTHCAYEFLFDRASELRSRGVVTGDRAVEDRIIVAYGRSTGASEHSGNGSRKNLLGSAAARFGDGSERSYLPGEVLGRTFDISVYPRYRDFEAERSADSRAYRAMKRYCSEHPGAFCFTRLVYSSRSWRPAAIEHGVLRADGSFWVQRFKNAASESRISFLPRNGRKASAGLTVAD